MVMAVSSFIVPRQETVFFGARPGKSVCLLIAINTLMTSYMLPGDVEIWKTRHSHLDSYITYYRLPDIRLLKALLPTVHRRNFEFIHFLGTRTVFPVVLGRTVFKVRFWRTSSRFGKSEFRFWEVTFTTCTQNSKFTPKKCRFNL